MHKGFIQTAVLLGALAVALGAFAAHGLREIVSDKALATFETAVRYQFYHVFALLAAGILYKDFPSVHLRRAGGLFIAGIFLFSGSLYLLTFFQAYRFIGAVTPFGGLAFIGGWIMMLVAVSKSIKR